MIYEYTDFRNIFFVVRPLNKDVKGRRGLRMPRKSFYLHATFFSRSRAMGLRNRLFNKIKSSLLVEGLSETEAIQLTRKTVEDRKESGVYPGGYNVEADNQGEGIGGLNNIPGTHMREDRCEALPSSACRSVASSPYRQIDGRCNNLRYPLYGAQTTPFSRAVPRNNWKTPARRITQRVKKLEKAPGEKCRPRKKGQDPKDLPSPRLVSTSVHKADTDISDRSLTHMVTQMAQFIDHDITLTPEEVIPMNCCLDKHKSHSNCFNIDIPKNDPFYSTLKPPVTCMSFHISTRFCEQNKDIDGRYLSLYLCSHLQHETNKTPTILLILLTNPLIYYFYRTWRAI